MKYFMKTFMCIWNAFYIIGIFLFWRIEYINENTYWICMGLWGIFNVLLNMWSELDER